jgi:catechol 2,3-dioxygenase-like lactoylglutathione lyase family enzyme
VRTPRPLAAVAIAFLVASCGCHRRSAGTRAGDGAPSAPASAPSVDPAATLLGGERGLDHVGIAVKDLDAATRTYRDFLGFSRPVAGRLPNGITNVNYYFADATYLETLTHYDRRKASWLADFTDRHRGALFLVLSVHSAESATTFLTRRGIEVSKPVSGTIQTAGEATMPEEKWQTLFLRRPLPGDPLYFIAYQRRERDAYLARLGDPRVRRIFRHANTALGTRAVWIAVDDRARAVQAYEALGLAPGRRFDDPRLGAVGQEIGAGAGAIWLLSPAAKDGPVAAFLRERGGPGIMGVTLEAGSVAVAARLIGTNTGRTFSSSAGPFGTSVLIPPDVTHGVWLEFAPRPGTGPR